jgi:sugar phosphate isomerase/epimerase
VAEIKFGVSPAYHISRYGDRFSPEDVAASLPDIRALGFSAFQLEVFHPGTLPDWSGSGAGLVAKAAERDGVYPSQFAGHFLLHGFSSAEALESDFGIPEMRACLEVLKPFPACSVITVVIPGFKAPPSGTGTAAYLRIWNRFVEKLKTMLRIAEDGGKNLALEILPGAIIGGLQGLLRLIDQLGSPALGYNLDTGHAWANHEAIELVPAMLAGRIFGTHLKDNNQAENLSLVPGRGTIPWDVLIKNILETGYRGNWDLEIRCESGKVRDDYAEGLEFLKSKLNTLKEY